MQNLLAIQQWYGPTNRRIVWAVDRQSDLSAIKKNFTLQGKPWHICASNALTGEGLTEGIEWLTDQLKDIIAQWSVCRGRRKRWSTASDALDHKLDKENRRDFWGSLLELLCASARKRKKKLKIYCPVHTILIKIRPSHHHAVNESLVCHSSPNCE